jgi:hypothetical protein
MKVLNSTVSMEGYSSHVSEQSQISSLRIWDNKSEDKKLSLPGNSNLGDHMTLSAIGLSFAQSQEFSLSEQLVSATTVNTDVDPLSANSNSEKSSMESLMSEEDYLKIKLLEKLLEGLTGKKFKFKYYALKDFEKALAGKDMPIQRLNSLTSAVIKQPPSEQPASVGWGVHFQQETTQYQKETVDFNSKGSVQTADGRSIDFQLNYHFSQEFWSSTKIDFKAGDALIDPLVIRLDEAPMQFSDKPIVFDLDIDGTKEAFKIPINNAGLLFLDQNGNHIADDGSELFGPQTGHGFDELKALDTDQNGWIDESDSNFNDLRIWIRSSDGSDQFLGLLEAGVGALFVSSVNTQTNLYAQNASQVGQMKMSGLYLKENGQPGLIHELDFKV